MFYKNLLCSLAVVTGCLSTALASCNDPGAAANANRYLTDFLVGSVATYTCHEGYQMNQDGLATMSRECLASGNWNTSLPTCSKISCGDPGDTTNTTHEGNHMYLDVVTYKCVDGYRMPDWSKKQQVKCTASKKWDPDPLGCVRIQCIEPETIPFANRTSAKVGPYWLNALLTYECWFGYRPKVSKDLSLTCGEKGIWSVPWPICLKIRCGDPGMVANAGRIVTGNGAGTVLIYSCNRGYIHKPSSGPLNMTCQENATWTGNGLPACVGINCGVPRSVANATFTPTNPTYRFPETLRYTCDPGYVANYTLGIDEITCTWQGKWDFAPFTCDRIRCIEMKMSENTDINNNYYYYGDMKVMKCLEGHELKNGSLKRRCEANRYFDNDPPICKKVQCPDPMKLNEYNKNVTVTGNGHEYKQIITLTCEKGFEINGSQSLTFRQSAICQADKTWKPALPVCARVSCGEPDKRLNVEMISSEGTKYGDTVSYSCSFGYEPYAGNDTRVCQSNRRWSGETFQCIEKSCGSLSSFDNNKGQVIGTNFRYKGQVSFKCNQGYELVGKQTIRCLANGTWDYDQPVCERIACSMPEDLPHTEWKSHTTVNATKYVYGDHIQYKCLYGYFWRTTSGPLNRTCTETTRWSGNRPICDPYKCGDPGDVNGAYKLGVKFTYGEIVNYTCSTGYESSSGIPWSIIKCQANKQWTTGKPNCKKIVCGDPGKGSNATRSVNTFDYEGTIRYRCNDGYYYPDGRMLLKCLETKNWSSPVPHCQVVPIFAPVKSPVQEIFVPAEAADAETYGYVGVALMSFEALALIILDLSTIQKEINLLRRNLNMKVKKAKKQIKKKLEHIKENIDELKEDFGKLTKKQPTFKDAGLAVVAGNVMTKGVPPPYHEGADPKKEKGSPPPPYLSIGAMTKLKMQAQHARERKTKYTYKKPANAPPPYSTNPNTPPIKKPGSRISGSSVDGSEAWARPVRPKQGSGGRKIYMA